jgi:hypothetical protein
MQANPSIESSPVPDARDRGVFTKLRSVLRGDKYMADAYEPIWDAPHDGGDTGDARLVERVERLESVVEGLQDALYRQARLQDEQIDSLRARTEPAELARTLSAHARDRGL